MKAWILMIVLILAFMFGFFLGVLVFSPAPISEQYVEASILTCNYANNLTDLVNIQNEIIAYQGGERYAPTDYINCTKLEILE